MNFIILHPTSSKVGLPRELLPAGYIARIVLCGLSGNAEFATKVRGAEKQGLAKTGVRSQTGSGSSQGERGDGSILRSIALFASRSRPVESI